MAPGDKFVRAAFSEAENEVDAAINQTVAGLFNDNSPKHHGDLFRIVRFPTGELSFNFLIILIIFSSLPRPST